MLYNDDDSEEEYEVEDFNEEKEKHNEPGNLDDETDDEY